MKGILEYDIVSMAQDLSRRFILDYMAGRGFMFHHDLLNSRTAMIVEDEHVGRVNASGIGFNVAQRSEGPAVVDSEFLCIPIAAFAPKDPRRQGTYPLDGIYGMFPGLETDIFTSFFPAGIGEVTRFKHDAEDRMSRMEVRLSQSTNYRDVGINTSTATDSYYQSHEKNLLQMTLDNIGEVLLSKGASYKVSFLIRMSDRAGDIVNYLKSNAVILGQQRFRARNVHELYYKAKAIWSLPLSYANATQAMGFSGRITRMNRVRTGEIGAGGDMRIGRYLDSAISEVDEPVSISSASLNLGTLITGLPGVGKTKLAQSLIEQASGISARVAVISPTGEWNGFGRKNSFSVGTLGKTSSRINLFRCESSNRRKFYENLAMLVATGCNSGPYKNSVEKCLLSAFSKVYAKTNSPDPQLVYEEIEEAIIEQHGKRTSTSVKYTKHGENARAALESLRQLLMMPQFAYSDGMSFAELVAKGAVFDLAEISNSSKPLVYAMILNQLYNMCDQFDLNGNDKIRLVLCLEESQLVFNADDESGATIDLRQRIQNFRKTGVGLMLITHNIIDISPGIRRLCQNKFYFRQSSDVAKYAANDLVFDELDYDKIIMILKTMGQKECAVNAITIRNGKRIVSNSILSRIDD